jgi:hypothetical protein
MKKFIIIFLLLLAARSAYTQAVVYIDPATYYKSVGDTAFVVFKISNVTDLHSSSVLVKFNNTVVKYIGAVNGTFYPGGAFFGTQPSLAYVKDSVFIDQAILGQSSVSGSGTMFTLKFKALVNGVSPVTIKNVELRTLANNEINYTSQNGLILVGGITANLKVFLQGPYNTTTNLMNTSLNTAGYIPLNQPYDTIPWNYMGTESVAPGFFGLNSSVVDWVLVELRTGTGGTTTVSKKAGLLKSNGSIVDYRDPNTPIIFEGISAGNYYVVIRHRNHLGVMTSSAISLSQSSALYDFSTGLDKYYGGDAYNSGTGIFGLYAGDVNGNGQIKYSGAGNDRIIILNLLGGNLLGTFSGYNSEDVNMNGQSKYSGAGNDRIIILNNLSGNLLAVKNTSIPN